MTVNQLHKNKNNKIKQQITKTSIILLNIHHKNEQNQIFNKIGNNLINMIHFLKPN
jgi:hypothetical protein